MRIWNASGRHWKRIQFMDTLQPRVGLRCPHRQFERRKLAEQKSPLLPLCCWPEPRNQPEAWTIRIRIDSSVHLDKGHDRTAHLARAAKGQKQHAREEGVQPNRLNHFRSATYIESPSNCFDQNGVSYLWWGPGGERRMGNHL